MAEIPVERLKELRSFANKGRDLHSHTAIDLLQEIDRLREALAEMTTYRDTCQRQLDAVDAKLGWIGTGSGRIEAIADMEATIEAQDRKLDALAPHGSCGCDVDYPGDLCAHHSPRLLKAEAERDAAYKTRTIWVTDALNQRDAAIRERDEVRRRIANIELYGDSGNTARGR